MVFMVFSSHSHCPGQCWFIVPHVCVCILSLFCFYGVLWILQQNPICTNRGADIKDTFATDNWIGSEMESAVQLKWMVVVMCSPMYTVLQPGRMRVLMWRLLPHTAPADVFVSSCTLDQSVGAPTVNSSWTWLSEEEKRVVLMSVLSQTLSVSTRTRASSRFSDGVCS